MRETADECGPTLALGPGASDITRHAAGAELGRYLVIDEIGRGGAGLVLRAYDPKLQREVALKCVRDDRLSTVRDDRVLREAQAMARLSHPNVVAVYDAELVGSDVIIAMELVRGKTLGAWLTSGRRTWQEIVEVFCAAGRGLQAAHDVDLLHRDFKPGNVLIGDDGSVKVTDFGIARSTDDAIVSAKATSGAHESVATALTNHERSVLFGYETVEGVIAGTPPYMAPEQGTDQPLGPQVDQYAFCTSLWQALIGELPFAAETGIQALRVAKRRGPPPWPEHVSVPRRVSDAIRRGLAVDPLERWPSMAALVAAIAVEERRNRPPRLALAAVVGLGGSALAFAWGRESGPQCRGADDQIAAVWNPQRRDAIAEVLRETGAGYVDAIWGSMSAELDGYAASWAAAHTEACEATTVRGEQSPEVLDLRMGCLRRAKVGLEAVAHELGETTASTVERVHMLLGDLPELARCADVESLRAAVPLPDSDAARATLQAIEPQLASVRSHLVVADYDAASTELEAVATQVESIQHAPVEAEWSLLMSSCEAGRGDYSTAERSLLRALEFAVAAHEWDTALDALSDLSELYSSYLKRPGEALAYAQMSLVFAKDRSDRDRARAHERYGTALVTAGRYQDAEAQYALALPLLDEREDTDLLAVIYSARATARMREGHTAEAESDATAALALSEALLGKDHPKLLILHSNLASVQLGRQRYAEAEAEYRRALEMLVQHRGPNHPFVGPIGNNLGIALARQGRAAEGEAEQRKALAVLVAREGERHPDVADTRVNLGNSLAQQGRHVEAEAEQRAALAIFLEVYGSEHPDVAVARHALGEALAGQQRFADAEVEYRAAVALRTALLGPDSPDLRRSLTMLADVLRAQRKSAEADRILARAEAIAH